MQQVKKRLTNHYWLFQNQAKNDLWKQILDIIKVYDLSLWLKSRWPTDLSYCDIQLYNGLFKKRRVGTLFYANVLCSILRRLVALKSGGECEAAGVFKV